MSINPNDNLIIGRGTDTYKYKYSDLVGSLNSDLTIPSPVVPGDGRITIKDSDGNDVGTFTVDQANDTDVTLPAAASVDLSGVVKLDDNGNRQTIIGGGGLDVKGQIKLPGAGGNDEAITKGEVVSLVNNSTAGIQDLSYKVNGNNAGTIGITDGTNADIPIVTNNTAGLMTGPQKQALDSLGSNQLTKVDLGYSANGNSAGSVTNTAGTNAAIPIVTNSVAGLMTGTQKQNLDNLVNQGSFTVSGTLPIAVVNNDVRINTNRGLKLNGSNLEADIGDGLLFDGNQIEADIGNGLKFSGNTIVADIPDAAVNVFAPIVVVNSSGHTENTRRNQFTKTSVWTGNFTIPDGVKEFSVIWRVNAYLKPLNTSDLWQGGTLDSNNPAKYSTLWVRGPSARLKFSGGGVETTQLTVSVSGITTAPVNDRSNGTILMRTNVLSVSGSGNRNISYQGDVSWEDAQGSGGGEVGWSALQMLIFPSE